MVENGAKMIYPKLPDYGDDTSMVYRPLEEEISVKETRNSTNRNFIFVFIFFITAWLTVAIYALCFISFVSYIRYSNDWAGEFKAILRKILIPVYDIMARSFLITPSYILFATGLMFLYILSLKGRIAKSFSYIAIAFMALSVVTSFLFIVTISYFIIETVSTTSNYQFENTVDLLSKVFIATVQFLYMLIILHCALKVKVNYITDIMQKSCKAIFHYECLVLFSSALLVLYLLVVFITVKVFITLENYREVTICHFINIIAGSYILLFITFFGQTVIARCVATWHQTTDTEEIPKSVLKESIKSTAKYHIGTIAFGSTIILPIMQAIHISFKTKINEAVKYDYAIIRYVTKVSLITRITDCALIQTAIHGYDFSESVKRSYYLVMSNGPQYLAVNGAFRFIFILITAAMSFIVGLAIDIMIYQLFFDRPEFKVPLVIFSVSVIMIYPYFCLLSTAVKTILLCTFDDVENNELREKPYLVNVQSQNIPSEIINS